MEGSGSSSYNALTHRLNLSASGSSISRGGTPQLVPLLAQDTGAHGQHLAVSRQSKRPQQMPAKAPPYHHMMLSTGTGPQARETRHMQEINKHIEAVQSRMTQDSLKLPTIMREVQKTYDEMHETAELQLNHRRDVANKVNDLNTNYVRLFEQMLEEVMRMQRSRMKV